MGTLTDFVDGLVERMTDDLQHQMVDLGLTKVEAIMEVMRDSTLGPRILRMGLERLDTRLAKGANDQPYYVVCMTGPQMIAEVSPKAMIEHGYTVKQSANDFRSAIRYSLLPP